MIFLTYKMISLDYFPHTDTLVELSYILRDFRKNDTKFGILEVNIIRNKNTYEVSTSNFEGYLSPDISIEIFEETLKQLNLYFEKEIDEEFGKYNKKKPNEPPIKTTYTYTITARRYKLLELRAPYPAIESIKSAPTDFSIVSSAGKNFPVHSFILKGWNLDYFKVVLSDKFKKQDSLELDYSNEIISVLVDYLYYLEQGVLERHPNLTLDKWSELLNLGDFLGFEALVNFCAYEIAQNFSPTEARDTLELYLDNNINNSYYNEVYNNIGTETQKEYILRMTTEKLIQTFPFLENEQEKIQVHSNIVFFNIIGDFKLTFGIRRKTDEKYTIYIKINNKSIQNIEEKRYFKPLSKYLKNHGIQYANGEHISLLDVNHSDIPISQVNNERVLELYNGILHDPRIIKNLEQKIRDNELDVIKYKTLLNKIKGVIKNEKDRNEILKHKDEIKGIKKHLDDAEVMKSVLKRIEDSSKPIDDDSESEDYSYNSSSSSDEKISKARLYRRKIKEAQLNLDFGIGSKPNEKNNIKTYEKLLRLDKEMRLRARLDYNDDSSDSDIDRALSKIRKNRKPKSKGKRFDTSSDEEFVIPFDRVPKRTGKQKEPDTSDDETESDLDSDDSIVIKRRTLPVKNIPDETLSPIGTRRRMGPVTPDTSDEELSSDEWTDRKSLSLKNRPSLSSSDEDEE